MDIENHLPTELSRISKLDTAIPKIAKDEKLLSVINQTLRSLPT
jgi:hypothetical protein